MKEKHTHVSHSINILILNFPSFVRFESCYRKHLRIRMSHIDVCLYSSVMQ